MKYRIPIWLPMAGTLVTFFSASTFTYLKLAQAFESEAFSHVNSQLALIERSLEVASGVNLSGETRNSAVDRARLESLAHSFISDIQKGTAAFVYKCQGDFCSLSSRNDAASQMPISLTRINELAAQPSGVTEEAGTRYYFSTQSWLLRTERSKPSSEYLKAVLVVDIDRVIDKPLKPFVQAKIVAALLISCWLGIGYLINVVPISLLRAEILAKRPIGLPKWVPIPMEDLAKQMRHDRSSLVLAVSESEKLAQVVENVNHIAAHDIKADLTALVKGSEVITETLEELQQYSAEKAATNGDEDDDVTADAIETALYFAGLNRNSASNAFDILDQRNKLHDLESRIEQSPCLVSTFLEALAATFATESGSLKIINTCSESQAFFVDYSLLLGAVKNMIRNGFIHNDSPLKTITVTASLKQSKVRLIVQDNGLGMPESYLKDWGRILGKAAQLNSSKGGSGIGLYSIRSILEAHKGATIDLQSTVGEGSTFTLEFAQHVA